MIEQGEDGLTLHVKSVYAPFERQRIFHEDAAKYRLFGGAAMGGKSQALRWEVINQCMAFAFWNGLILRTTVPELQQSQINKFRSEFPSEAYAWSEQKKTAVFHNKSTLRFAHAGNDEEITRFRSDEYGVIAFDELTLHTLFQWLYMKSRNRSTTTASHNMIAASNPGGRGHEWVKSLWIDKRPAVGMDAVEYVASEYSFTPSRVTDNPYASEEYIEDLKRLPRDLRSALYEGNWDFASGAYFEIWDSVFNTYNPQDVVLPEYLPRWISADWGFRHSAAVYWHVFDGERTYTYRELVINATTPIELAQLIVQMTPPNEREYIKGFYFSPDAFGVYDSERTIASDMGAILVKEGMPGPLKADNSREVGWTLMYQQLLHQKWVISRGDDAKDQGCPKLIRTIPILVRNTPKKPYDIVKMEGDDTADAARYGIQTAATRMIAVPSNVEYRELLAAKARNLGFNNPAEQDPNVLMMQHRLIQAELRQSDGPVMFRGSGRRRLEVN